MDDAIQDCPRQTDLASKDCPTSRDAAHGALMGTLAGDAAGATLKLLCRTPSSWEVDNALRKVSGDIWGTAPGQITDDGELTFALTHAAIN